MRNDSHVGREAARRLRASAAGGGARPTTEKILLYPVTSQSMADDGRTGRFQRLLKSTLRSAGRQIQEAKTAYADAKRSALADLPQNDDGKARIVCRRYAERRAVSLDERARPACFDADHPDCQGCAEDVRDGTVETW